MTDTDQMVVWLRETLDAAQADAEAAGGDEWRREEHPSDTVAIYDSKGGPVVYDEGSPTEAQQAHIVRHGPAAVLRRIAADRELLAECEAILSDPAMKDYDRETFGGLLGYRHALAVSLAEVTIRNLAEGYGWKEDHQ